MINYRLYNGKDFNQVKDLCHKHKIAIPEDSKYLIVAENEQGGIIGIGAIQTVVKVEPLISEGNSLVANNIWHALEGILLVNKIPKVVAFVAKDNEKQIGHLEKTGWVITETNNVILEKTYEV